MAAHDKAYERGSEWRKWDLHIHTPASFHCRSQNRGPDSPDRDRRARPSRIALSFGSA